MRIIFKVIPQSGKQLIVWDQKQSLLRCYLKSAPEKNKANEEFIAFISQKLGVPRSACTIVGGACARRKMITVAAGLSRDECYHRLGVLEDVGAQQQSLA